MIKIRAVALILACACFMLIPGCSTINYNAETEEIRFFQEIVKEDIGEIEPYTGSPYAIVNGNVPYFTKEDISEESFERYSSLDDLGRCGTAFANIGKELMPTEERGSIGQVKPTGWHTVKYDIVDGKYLYNRCHLIGYQLTAENANEKNLITGTRYMNVEGMLPFENMVADYIKETGNHVLYRVSPVYEGNNRLAQGVRMEAMSVEDGGAGIQYHVFVYNIQPGIEIDYATGESWLAGETKSMKHNAAAQEENSDPAELYILNTNSMKFHKSTCTSVSKINKNNKTELNDSRDNLILQGYFPCVICKP